MKKLSVTVFLFLCFLSARPQRTADIGVLIGAAAYWGDIQNVDYTHSITALYGVLGRYNFNKRMSIRGQLVAGKLKAFTNVGKVFNRSIQTVEALFEFNFLDYQMGSIKKNRFTPFLSLGIGGFYSNVDGPNLYTLSPIIPMGFGIKYNITKRLGACVEFCVQKTFTDNIDNLVDPVSSNKLINNDWYASLQLSLHWQVWSNKANCKVNDPNAKYGKKSAF